MRFFIGLLMKFFIGLLMLFKATIGVVLFIASVLALVIGCIFYSDLKRREDQLTKYEEKMSKIDERYRDSVLSLNPLRLMAAVDEYNDSPFRPVDPEELENWFTITYMILGGGGFVFLLSMLILVVL
jgi:hypothetical protein